MKILVTDFACYKSFQSNAGEALVCSLQTDLSIPLVPHSDHIAFAIISFEDGDACTQSRSMTNSACGSTSSWAELPWPLPTCLTGESISHRALKTFPVARVACSSVSATQRLICYISS